MSVGSAKGDARATFRRTLGLFAPFQRQLLLLIALITLTSTLGILPFLLIQRIVDEAAPGTGDPDRILALTLVMIGLYLASSLLGVLRGYVNQRVGQGVMLNLRSALHDHLQRVSVRFYTQTRSGEILSRVTADVNAVQEAVTTTFTMLLIHSITLAVALAAMFSLEWRLALGVVLVLPIWVYPTLRVGEIQRSLLARWREESANMTSHLAETLSVSGAMLVKTFGREEHESRRFEASNRTLRDLSIKRFLAGRWFNTSTELFGSLVVAVVYGVGAHAVITGGIPSIGVVVAFAGLAGRVIAPFRQLARIQTTALASLALFERIFEFLDLPVEVEERARALSLVHPRGGLAFEHVSFSYDSSSPSHGPKALDDVSFAVAPGQMVALVGPSGAGKSTITYLLKRFYDPDEGRVLLDGHDLRDLTLETVSRTVGSVMQDTMLFHGPLEENIRYGRLEANDEEVEQAARTAGLGPLVDSLPDGLATIVGERGHRLSGGERQRVAIARAIVKDPPVLVLDEATASLDSRLEREIRDATEALVRGRTTFVIAHRLSTVVAADIIIGLDEGRIVEMGSHEQLLERGGLYAELHRAQRAEEHVRPEDAAVND